MILQLATKYQKGIAFSFFLVFYLSLLAPAYAGNNPAVYTCSGNNSLFKFRPALARAPYQADRAMVKKAIYANGERQVLQSSAAEDIDGPSQPEMSSFKSVNTDNMVNLFTGDFSYNIPLLDVGGYPVNIFYDGNVSMEQEASWVGLGWNINPGNINRNMRGIPDDFDGTDSLIQTQKMKPNVTWGMRVGADWEFGGRKVPANITGSAGPSIGVSFNNYLGVAFDLGIKGGLNFMIANKTLPEKSAADSLKLKASLNVDANLSSRDGFSLSPNVSFTASAFKKHNLLSNGISLATSYNSRSGIKQLQLSDQMSFNLYSEKVKTNEKGAVTGKLTSSSFMSESILGTSISFAKPSYIPAIRMPVTNSAISGRFQLGTGIFGTYISEEMEVYNQTSYVAAADVKQVKPLVGYLYYQNAQNNANAVMDFTRLNDKEVTPNTPIISAPQYTYDVFSVQGEGTGGSFRAYRNDLGYVRDNSSHSQDVSSGLGVDIGPPGHYGGNFNIVKTPTTIGEWVTGNNLKTSANVRFGSASGMQENVYLRNPGENSVLSKGQFDKIGGTDLVRFALGTSSDNPTVEPTLQHFSAAGYSTTTTSANVANLSERKKRSQVISFLTAAEASKIGLDTVIKNYNYQNLLDAANNLQFDTIRRVGYYRKSNHISQVNITEANGKRYVYGLPVYNISQKDFSFTVQNAESLTDPDKVTIANGETDVDKNPFLDKKSSKDGYFQSTETPAYAHSFLLTGLLSQDYVDVTGNGITEDDLGNAVKFNYSRMKNTDGNWSNHLWRSPETANMANFNAGNRTQIKDDKGIIASGTRESWYLQSIESKTMIAIFTLEDRKDGKGVSYADYGGVNNADNSIKRLRQIDLYSKSDLKKNGLQAAKPIKTVHFQYTYELCRHTPDNANTVADSSGKLTLKNIYFTYNGQDRSSKNPYLFSYENTSADNPDYAFNASDRWGTYKPVSMNPQSMKNADYPYAVQPDNTNTKAAIDQNAGAWLLKKILLPSGGQMEVQYESDDYAFTQNKRAATMMSIAGFGSTSTTITNNLYDISGSGIVENDYVFINLPEALGSTDSKEILQKYLQGVGQLAFRLSVNMPNGVEYLTSYATIDSYGAYKNDVTTKKIWIKLREVDGRSPLSLTAIEYLREQLPDQAYPSSDVSSDETDWQKVGHALVGMLVSFKEAFDDPIDFLRKAYLAQSVVINKSFVRLNDPDGIKQGGGYRVKAVKLKDNWEKMTGQYTSDYGQVYDYTTTEVFNGSERTISSGVASYEPSLGGDENPFQTIVQVASKLPLGPASYGAIEMPVLDAFFPSPVVGYSKVTVRSTHNNADNTKPKIRSGIGKQVTEFYTAKDFPTYCSYTPLDPASDKQAHVSNTTAFIYKYAYDSRALSQGFLIATNDMHGKMKSQTSYPENDDKTPIKYTQNFYRNTGVNGLNEKFDFLYASQGGIIDQGNMGVDVELMNDVREFSVKSSSDDIQGQLDFFPAVLPFWLPFIWNVSGNSENTYRAVTATKVINYHSVLDSVVVIDKGSQVSTKNLVYDSETGDVLITRTNNEFDQPVYNTNYPAWWAYSGMGPAYKNIDAVYTASFNDGKIVTTGFDQSVFESGDELYIMAGNTPSNTCAKNFESFDKLVWAYDKNKNSATLTSTPDLIFMDDQGNLFNKDNVQFRIVRSGKRNMLDAQVAGITTMVNPIVTSGSTRKLTITTTSKTVAASATEYKEKWQTDNDVFNKLSLVYDNNTCTVNEVSDCNGYLEKHINPYRKGLVGNFKPYRSLVFYGDRTEKDPAAATNISQNGFLDNFKLYWDFNTSKKLLPDAASTKWIWNSQLTRTNARGMELETKNALNIYTAAQYGYNKNLPVAITNNARYDEAAYENFEDYNYSESVNNTAQNACGRKHIDFGTITNAAVINTDSKSFNAHTGKYVLTVNKSSSASKSIAVTNELPTDYSIQFGNDTTKTLSQIGGTLTKEKETKPPCMNLNGYVVNQESYSKNGKLNTLVEIAYSTTDCYNTDYGYTYSTEQYIEVSQSGTYILNLNVYQATDWSAMSPSGGVTIFAQNSGVAVKQSFLSNTTLYNGYIVRSQVCLPKGIYKIVGSYSSWRPTTCYSNCNGPKSVSDHYAFYFENLDGDSYKTLSTINGCKYTTPIPANDSMLNPVFTIPAGKQMVFSAWVREKCTDPKNNSLPCTSYNNSKIALAFDDGSNKPVEIIPSGPVIEGWQRCEGYFTAPSAATAMTMNLINSSADSIYFDDIRMHPYNANMKSYVYDPVSLRLLAELDANNYASFYEYNEEGTLIRTKAETIAGIKTLNETRSATQRSVTGFQPK